MAPPEQGDGAERGEPDIPWASGLWPRRV